MISVNATKILDENKDGILTEKSRRQLIRHIIDYQTKRFGPKPSLDQRQAIVTATGFLFECLSTVSEKSEII